MQIARCLANFGEKGQNEKNSICLYIMHKKKRKLKTARKIYCKNQNWKKCPLLLETKPKTTILP